MRSSEPDAFRVRPITIEEQAFLDEMLYEALFVPEGEPVLPRSVIFEPSLSCYRDDWGKGRCDIALVAERDGMLVGAIWGRLFTDARRGYGFVHSAVPEIGMAVYAAYRRQGIGGALLREIEIAFKAKGVSTLSLSVAKANHVAYRFYLKSGFRVFCEAAGSLTMTKPL